MPLTLAYGSLALLALAILAFWPTYLSKPFDAVDRYTHFHAAVGTLWLTLLIAQPVLIAKRRPGLHRLIGRTSWAMAPLFVLSAVLLAHFRFSSMDDATFSREAYTLYLPLSAAFLFAVTFLAAQAHRRRTPLHARFMACTALVLVDPVVGRVLAFHVIELPEFWHYQVVTFAVEALLLLALFKTLAPETGDRRTFGTIAGLYLVVLLLWFVAARTEAWLSFAQWFRQQPFT